MKHNAAMRRFKELQHIEDEKLEARRELLRQLYEKDEQKYRLELMKQEGSSESRRDIMRKRIAELREVRERDRKVVVEQKLDKQWRQNCDELRQLESKIRGK